MDPDHQHDEDLPPGENKARPVPNGRHLDIGGVRARVGLGQRKAAGSIAFNGGKEIALLLLRVDDIEDVVGESSVREGDQRPGRLHADQRRHQHAEVGAPVFLRRQQAPKAGRSCLLLKPADLNVLRKGTAVEFGALGVGLQGQQLSSHELAHGAQDQALFAGQTEIHRGVSLP